MSSNQAQDPGLALGVAPWKTAVASEPLPANDADPRLELSGEEFGEASRIGFPIVAKHKARRDSLGLAAGGAIALVLGGGTFLGLSSSRTATEPSSSQRVSAVPQQQSSMAPAVPPPELQAMPEAMSPHDSGFAEPEAMTIGPGHMAPVAMGPSPVVVFDGSSFPAPAVAPSSTAADEASGTPQMLSGATNMQGIASSDASAARSTRIADPAHTITQGTLIAAVLETSINSDLPGFARAVVSQDIRSFDGSRILVPRSSRLIGEYKTAQQSGQKRVYLLWTRLLRPDGVSIALASPAVDSAGEAGIGGRANTHFFDRLGSALLMSVVGGVGALASGGSTVVVTGGQSAASLAASNDSRRYPTIRVKQGEPIRVFTARDLIFTPLEGGNR